MGTLQKVVVTGAFGYIGRYIASLLVSQGRQVLNLTGHPHRPNPFGDRVDTARLRFDDPPALARELQGASVLFNTYWVRFPRGETTFDSAVEDSRLLIRAASQAGVHRIVHISITNPSTDSPLPYFKGKAIVEQAIIESGISYSILRPTVVFGGEDILINNIAWLLRRAPLFGVPGKGDYRLQPVFVEDLAEMAVRAGESEKNEILDAVGPEIYTFEDLVVLIRRTVRSRAKIVHLHPRTMLFFARLIGFLVGDVVLTQDEIKGLMADLLVSADPPTGHTSLGEWLAANAGTVGRRYASELARHYR